MGEPCDYMGRPLTGARLEAHRKQEARDRRQEETPDIFRQMLEAIADDDETCDRVAYCVHHWSECRDEPVGPTVERVREIAKKLLAGELQTCAAVAGFVWARRRAHAIESM